MRRVWLDLSRKSYARKRKWEINIVLGGWNIVACVKFYGGGQGITTVEEM